MEVKTEEAKKFKSLQEALSKEEETTEDTELLAELLDAEGKLKVDTSLPEDYELEIMAQQLLAHLTSYYQNKETYRAARNSGDQGRKTQIWNQMQFNQLTAALIQRAYPKAKALADQFAKIQAKQAATNRERALAEGE